MKSGKMDKDKTTDKMTEKGPTRQRHQIASGKTKGQAKDLGKCDSYSKKSS